jgi:hypothetical protein
MSIPNSNAYVFNGSADTTASTKYFSDSTRTGVDGLRRMKCLKFNIRNIDSANSLGFSFDNTNWATLDYGASFGSELFSDRYYVRNDSSSGTCLFQVLATIQGNGNR